MRALVAFVLVMVFLAAAVGHAVLTPMGGGDDEYDHLDHAAYLAYFRQFPDPRSEHVGQIQHPPLAYALQAVLLRALVDRTVRFEGPPRATDGDLLGRRTLFAPRATLLSEQGLDEESFGDPARYPEKGRVLFTMPHAVRYGLRFWSVLLGLVTLLFGALAVRSATGVRLPFAVATIAAVALTPSFTFTSAMINNDGALHAGASLACWLGLRAWSRDRLGSSRTIVGLGLVLGLCFLVKLHAIGVAAFLFFLIVGDRRLAPRRRLAMGCLLVGVTAVVSAWWHLRQAWLLGSPAPGTLHARTMPQLLRAESLTPFGVLELAGDALRGFFGIFGPDQLDTVSLYYFPVAGGLLLALGAVVLLDSRPDDSGRRRPPCAALFGGLAVLVLGFLLANRTHYHVHGRYLFSLLPVIAILLLEGLRRLCGARAEGVVGALAIWNAGFTLFTVFVVVAGVYSIPLAKVTGDRTHTYIDVGGEAFDRGAPGGQRGVTRDARRSRPEDDYRVAVQTSAEAPLVYRIEGLMADRDYRVRVRYPSLKREEGDLPEPSAQALMADDHLVHGGHSIWNFEEPLVFGLPRAVTRDGVVTLRWVTRTPARPLVACAELWVEEEPLIVRRRSGTDLRQWVTVTGRYAPLSGLFRVVAVEEGRVLHVSEWCEFGSDQRTQIQLPREVSESSELRFVLPEQSPFLSRKLAALVPPDLWNASWDVPDLEVVRPALTPAGSTAFLSLTTGALEAGDWILDLTSGGAESPLAADIVRLTATDAGGRQIAITTEKGEEGRERLRLKIVGAGPLTLELSRGEHSAPAELFLDRLELSPAPEHPGAGRLISREE